MNNISINNKIIVFFQEIAFLKYEMISKNCINICSNNRLFDWVIWFSNDLIYELYRYSSKCDGQNLYILFEYIPGGELFSYLRNVQRFPDITARFYACEVILALEYLHSKNIVSLLSNLSNLNSNAAYENTDQLCLFY